MWGSVTIPIGSCPRPGSGDFVSTFSSSVGETLQPSLLIVVGQPGVGRSSLINTLFSTAIVPEQRDRMGAAMDGYPQLATYVGDRVEGGVRLQINVAELLGYTSPARLQEEGYSTRLLDYLRQRHYECHRAECQPVREVAEIHDGLVHAVLYLVPPTFQQFSDAELELFRELQKLTLLVPVIPKADMYTAEELKSRKMMVGPGPRARSWNCRFGLNSKPMRSILFPTSFRATRIPGWPTSLRTFWYPSDARRGRDVIRRW